MPWKKRFSLTPAEIALVDKLLAGKSLQEAARERKITYETARSTLKSVFFKTGTHRQSELIIRLLTKVTAAIFLIACGLWAPNVLAQEEYLTLQSWTACPTIQNTIEMLVFDGLTAHC